MKTTETRVAEIELYAKLLNILTALAGVALFTFLYNRVRRDRMLYALVSVFIVAFLMVITEDLAPNYRGSDRGWGRDPHAGDCIETRVP